RSLETGHHPKNRPRLRRVPEVLDPGDEAIAAKKRRVPRNAGRRVRLVVRSASEQVEVEARALDQVVPDRIVGLDGWLPFHPARVALSPGLDQRGEARISPRLLWRTV